MDEILGEIYNKGVLCYIDDIIIYANSFQEWLRLIDEVLTRLDKGGIYIEPKKCELGSKRIELLGHIITKEGIFPNPKKIEAIKDAKEPSNKKELMSFLGLIGFIRRFIPNYSKATVNLSNLLKKGKQYEWTKEYQVEFEHLRELVMDCVMLSVSLSYGPYVILTDASDKAIGAVLCQWDGDKLNILEFGSKKFSLAEVNWSARERSLCH